MAPKLSLCSLCHGLQALAKLRRRGALRLDVSRGSIAKHAFRTFGAVASTAQLRTPVTVTFIGEPAIDCGGPRREWFQLLSQSLALRRHGLLRITDSADLRCKR